MIISCRAATLLVASLIAGAANGFITPSPAVMSNRVVKHTLHMSDSTGWDSFATVRSTTDIPYGEESRKFRRTVYSHDDWKKHRSPDRFLFYLGAILKSGVYKNLGREVGATTLVASFVCVWNILTGTYVDLEGVKHAGILADTFLPVLGLPLAPFTLASPSLGLLLGKLKQRKVDDSDVNSLAMCEYIIFFWF